MGTSKFTRDQMRKATDLFFETGMSQSEICRRLGYPSQPTLSRWVIADPRYASAGCEPRHEAE